MICSGSVVTTVTQHTHTPVCVAVLPNTVIASILTKRFIERTYPPEKHIQWEDSVIIL